MIHTSDTRFILINRLLFLIEVHINAFESMTCVISKLYQVVNQPYKVDNIVINKYHGLISPGQDGPKT